MVQAEFEEVEEPAPEALVGDHPQHAVRLVRELDGGHVRVALADQLGHRLAAGPRHPRAGRGQVPVGHGNGQPLLAEQVQHPADRPAG